MKRIYYKNIEAYAPDEGIEIIPIPTQTGADKEASQFFKNHYPGYELISIMEHHVFTTDEPDPKTMYDKARYALNQMLEFIYEQFGEYYREENFPKIPVLPFKNERVNSLRGNCDYKIYIGGYDRCFVGGFCDDGYFLNDKIEDKVSRYGYIDSEQKIIDITTKMASNWMNIKKNVINLIADYKQNKKQSYEILDNFKI